MHLLKIATAVYPDLAPVDAAAHILKRLKPKEIVDIMQDESNVDSRAMLTKLLRLDRKLALRVSGIMHERANPKPKPEPKPNIKPKPEPKPLPEPEDPKALAPQTLAAHARRLEPKDAADLIVRSGLNPFSYLTGPQIGAIAVHMPRQALFAIFKPAPSRMKAQILNHIHPLDPDLAAWIWALLGPLTKTKVRLNLNPGVLEQL